MRRVQPSAGARERLIEAALDAFGRDGFDGAGTREIARQARTNLAAIGYYFGGKEGLHRAVAAYLVANIRERIGSLVATAEPGGDLEPHDRGTARILLHRLVDAACDMLVANPEAVAGRPSSCASRCSHQLHSTSSMKVS